MKSAKQQLRSLEPTDELSISFLEKHQSSLHVGSFLQSLRSPTRYVETHRKYIAGDPLKFIDWKVYARNDKIMIREKREESRCVARVVIDAGSTMRWPSEEEKPHLPAEIPSKLEIAFRLGLNILNNHFKNGDEAHLYLIDRGMARRAQIASSEETLRAFNVLSSNNFSFVSFEPYLSDSSGMMEKGAHVKYIISDFIDLKTLNIAKKNSKNYALHLLSSLEKKIDWLKPDKRYTESHDLKNDLEGKVILDQYQAKFYRWNHRLKETLNSKNYTYISLSEKSLKSDLAFRLVEERL